MALRKTSTVRDMDDPKSPAERSVSKWAATWGFDLKVRSAGDLGLPYTLIHRGSFASQSFGSLEDIAMYLRGISDHASDEPSRGPSRLQRPNPASP
jgi:hypothetical protein